MSQTIAVLICAAVFSVGIEIMFQLWYVGPRLLEKEEKILNHLASVCLLFHTSVYEASVRQKTYRFIKV